MKARRGLVATLALGLMVGCSVIHHDGQAPRVRLDGSVSRSYPAQVTRVAVAVFESLKPDVEAGDFDFSIDKGTSFSVDPKARPAADPADKTIPVESVKIDELVCHSAELSGKTKDGRAVRIELWARRFVEETSVTIQVGKSGDEALSKTLLDRIADRLAHPEHAPGSPEEHRQLEKRLGLDKAKFEADFNVAAPPPIR